MQKLKLTKRMMQAALLLGASRGYVGGKFICAFSYLRGTTSTAVAASALSTVVAQGLPITLHFGVLAGILIACTLSSTAWDLKEAMSSRSQNLSHYLKIQIFCMWVSSLCFLFGCLLLEWYTSMAIIISIIALLNCAFNIARHQDETVNTYDRNSGACTPKPAIDESKVFVYTLIGFETLATLIAVISSFATISVFGMPLIMIIFYLKVALTLFNCCVAPMVPGWCWYKCSL